MLGWGYVGRFLPIASGERTGWIAGLLIGIAYAAAVIKLALAPRGTRDRAVGDTLLLALGLLAIADIIWQLSRAELHWLYHAIAVAYAGGLIVALRRLRRSAHGR